MSNIISRFSKLIDKDNLLTNKIEDFIIYKPKYYYSRNIFTTTDYFNLIIYKIKNLHRLENNELLFISNLNKDYCNKILNEFNNLIDLFALLV